MLHYHTHLWSLPRGVYVLALVGMLLAAQVPLAGAAQPSLERDVLPILTKNCMGCHGGLKQEGGLDLRTVPTMLKGGESGPAIKSGRADESELWRRIEADEMPEGDTKLSADDKATIRTWITAGLPTLATLQKADEPILSPGKKHEPREVAAAIDRHVQATLIDQGLKAAPRSDDAEFLRRIYLDLTGRVPTAEQAAAFLDNSAKDNRAVLIDELLSKPEFGEQLGRTWRDWISPPELPSDANGGKQPHKEAQNFGRWLGERLTANDSWDKIVRDILTVEGEIKNQPQVIFFGLVGQDGKETADGSMRAVASLFMGVQLQCAQCHDDPYRDWSQQEHWALASFFEGMDGDFNKITEKKDHKSAEIAIPKTAFKNVGQMVPASFLRSESPLPQGQAAQRRQLVEWLTSQDNPYFDKAFANRLWFYFFSRGIVMPVDDFRELNPPSHPGLMELLAGEFAASQFDVKHLVRCITNSETYQATSRIEAGANPAQTLALTKAFGRVPLRLMTADMLYDSLKLAYGDPKLDLRAIDPSDGNASGESAPVGDQYLEFLRRFETNEDDPTEFIHGIPQMLTMINHPRLLKGSKALDEYLKSKPMASPEETVEWLYLSTLSRRPTTEERNETLEYVNETEDQAAAYAGVLWMLVNRSEFLFVR